MNLSWKLGRVAGIDLFLHVSALLWFLLPVYLASRLENAMMVVAILGSIVLHELGHAMMARQYGIATADITLYLFGGVARLERMPRSSGPELLITLAGPAVNFAIVAVLQVLFVLLHALGLPTPAVLAVLQYLNLFLGVFNLLPVFPMDGGRVLRALLSGWIGRLRATEVAASIGRSIAILGGIYFLLTGSFWSIPLVLFVVVAGSMELNQVRSERGGSRHPDGLLNDSAAPAGFRWANAGDGVWRLVPIMVQSSGRYRSWS